MSVLSTDYNQTACSEAKLPKGGLSYSCPSHRIGTYLFINIIPVTYHPQTNEILQGLLPIKGALRGRGRIEVTKIDLLEQGGVASNGIIEALGGAGNPS